MRDLEEPSLGASSSAGQQQSSLLAPLANACMEGSESPSVCSVSSVFKGGFFRTSFTLNFRGSEVTRGQSTPGAAVLYFKSDLLGKIKSKSAVAVTLLVLSRRPA